MAGGLLAGLGLILASQATSLFHLYLSMGVMSGLGWGLIFSPMMATVIAHFTRRRTLALGVSLSSIGLSAFAFNPLFQMLKEMYTWRGALLISGALSFNIIPCGALIQPKKPSLAAERVAASLFNAGYFVPYFHLVAHSRQVGFSEYQAAFVLSAAGATDILGRIFSGWFSDLGHFRLIHLLAVWTALTGLSILLLPVSSLTALYPALMVVSSVYGFCSGALTSLVFAVLPQIVGVSRVMGALGLFQMIESGAGLIGTPLSGRAQLHKMSTLFVLMSCFHVVESTVHYHTG
uniref:Solute carrier family 16 member 13 n=1 Tax=Neogobius melanostomus TaxID=47308 RepID=A0A8C6THS3_9GOBI